MCVFARDPVIPAKRAERAPSRDPGATSRTYRAASEKSGQVSVFFSASISSALSRAVIESPPVSAAMQAEPSSGASHVEPDTLNATT